MNRYNQNTLFNVAMVSLAGQVGSEEAIELLFKTLDEKVESNQAIGIVKSFFSEADLELGEYDENSVSFSNESELKSILATKLDIILQQPRIV